MVEFMGFLIAAVVSFLGIFGGVILAWIAPEERKPGMKYFVMAEIVILSLIAAFISYLWLNIWITAAIAFFCVFLFAHTHRYRKSYFVYALLGALLFVASRNDSMLLVVAVLIFVYGLVVGTMITDPKQKKIKTIVETLVYHLPYIVVAVGLWLVFNFF